MRKVMIASATAIGLALSSPAWAAAEADDPVTVKLDDWSYEALYSGLSADELIDMEVLGPNGDDIGEIHNLILGPEGTIEAVLIEGGGFLDIGDTHFRVPWNEVEMAEGADAVRVPVTEENVEDYALFEGEFVPLGVQEWKATDLLEDWAVLRSGVAFGIVTDLIFDRGGTMQSVVVDADRLAGYAGPYALPYYPGLYNPYVGYWPAPYARDEVAVLEPFDEERMQAGETTGSVEEVEPAAGSDQESTSDSDQQTTSE